MQYTMHCVRINKCRFASRLSNTNALLLILLCRVDMVIHVFVRMSFIAKIGIQFSKIRFSIM